MGGGVSFCSRLLRCGCVCIYIYVCVCVYLRMGSRTGSRMGSGRRVGWEAWWVCGSITFGYSFGRSFVCMRMRTCAYDRSRIRSRSRSRIRIRIRIHIHIRIHIPTSTLLPSPIPNPPKAAHLPLKPLRRLPLPRALLPPPPLLRLCVYLLCGPDVLWLCTRHVSVVLDRRQRMRSVSRSGKTETHRRSRSYRAAADAGRN